MKKLIAIILTLFFFIPSNLLAKDKLTIYTYNSFTSEWGPGPKLKTLFEKTCNCHINYVALDDGVSILNRLIIEREKTKADIILGLDLTLTETAKHHHLVSTHNIQTSKKLSLPIEWKDPYFIPFDYGYYAFIYNKSKFKNPPKSLSDLLNTNLKRQILIQDPRTSAPGLGFMLWVQEQYQEEAAHYWKTFQKNILTVTKNWSEAYGLFLKNEAPLVLSYTTSPAYHIHNENTDDYQAAMFEEGHYIHIETASISNHSQNKKLAQLFLSFLISETAQEVIPTTNWMYPVVDIGEKLPDSFKNLPIPNKTLLIDPQKVKNKRKSWVNTWRNAFYQ